jgi:hypothetical protein
MSRREWYEDFEPGREESWNLLQGAIIHDDVSRFLDAHLFPFHRYQGGTAILL